MKLTYSADDRADGGVDLKIEYEDDVVERIVVRIPPQAERKEMVEAALRSMVHERQRKLRNEHAHLLARLDRLQAGAARKEQATPPVLAELFISFLAPKYSAQALLGDLQEVFEKNAERHGAKQARRKYWIEVARSLGPLIWQWLKRVGFFTVLIDYFRSKFGF